MHVAGESADVKEESLTVTAHPKDDNFAGASASSSMTEAMADSSGMILVPEGTGAGAMRVGILSTVVDYCLCGGLRSFSQR